jgi:alpha-D-xyloside xylohydrolase
MRPGWSRALVLLAFTIPALGARDGTAAPLRLETDRIAVEVEPYPFRLRVLDADGAVMLDGLTKLEAPGAPFDPFGPLGYSKTQDVTVGKPPYYGYDWFQGLPSEWHHATQVVAHELTEGRMRLTLATEDVRAHRLEVTIELLGERSFRFSAKPGEAKIANRMAQSFRMPANERYYGFGERFFHAEQRGRKVYNWVEDGGFGLGGLLPKYGKDPFPYGPMMTNWPVPFLLSSRGYGIWLDTTHRSTFDLGSEHDGTLRFEVEQGALDWVYFHGPQPLDVLEQFTARIGRAPLPALWAFAPRVRANLQTDWPEQLRAAKAGVTGIDTALHFLPGGGHVGAPDYFRENVARVNAMGFEAISYFNNFVSADYHPVYDEGAANGYFVKTPGGEPYIVGYPGYLKVANVDFTNPAAVEWYQRLLDESADLGFRGFMYDFAEYIPRDAVFHDGRRGDEMHDLYPVLYHKAA